MYIFRFFCLVALWLPGLAWAGSVYVGNATNFTTSTAQISSGTSYGTYVVTTTYVGPQTLLFYDLGTCTYSGPALPNSNCTISSGSGTSADPYIGQCTTRLTLGNCSSGDQLVLLAGQTDIDTIIYSVVPAAATSAGGNGSRDDAELEKVGSRSG